MNGVIASWYTQDSVTAERELARALAIDTTSLYALSALGTFVAVRYPDSAGVLFVRAARHNPMSTVALYFSAIMPSMQRAMSPDTATIVCERLRRAVPVLGDNCDALRLDHLGRRREAQQLLQSADTTGFSGGAWSWRAYAAVLIGDTVTSRRLLARASIESERQYVREDFVAWTWIELGDAEEALRWTQRAAVSRASGATGARQRFAQRFPNDRVRIARLDSTFARTSLTGRTQ